MAGRRHGTPCAGRLGWLERQLEALVARHPHVERVVRGHVHRLGECEGPYPFHENGTSID
ncbi:MAG: hypothetical protein ACRYGA_18590 [Janthinobacterium lividum]